MPIYDEETGQHYRTDDDGNRVVYQDEGSGGGNNYTAPDYSTYQPWNYNVIGGQENFAELYGGNPYNGRVTDWSHIDPVNYQANVYANDTRERLWNYYNSVPEDQRNPLNPDQFADKFQRSIRDYYTDDGNVNNAALRSANAGMNTLSLADHLSSLYIPNYKSSYTPEQVYDFGVKRQAQVPTLNEFTSQAQGNDWWSVVGPMVMGAAFGGLTSGAYSLGAQGAGSAASGGTGAWGSLDGAMADSALNYNSMMGFNPTGGSIGLTGGLENLWRSPEVQTLKDGYNTFNKAKGIYNNLSGLFSNNDVPATSGMLPPAQQQRESSGLENLYNSSLGNNNLDPYGLNQRRRSFGRR